MLAVDEQRSHPVGGIDYPPTLQEFNEWFATEDSCARYVMRMRWPQGAAAVPDAACKSRG